MKVRVSVRETTSSLGLEFLVVYLGEVPIFQLPKERLLPVGHTDLPAPEDIHYQTGAGVIQGLVRNLKRALAVAAEAVNSDCMERDTEFEISV